MMDAAEKGGMAVTQLQRAGSGLPERLTRLFYAVFAACFAFALVSALFRGAARTVPGRLALGLGAVLCAAALFALARLIFRYGRALEARFGAVLAVFSAAMFALMLFLALNLRHGVWFDAAALCQGAAEWAETGTFASFYDYYGYFPNNLGGMAFLYLFFKAASLIGFTDYYAVAVLVNCALLTASMAAVALACRKLAGAAAGVLALAVFALSPQFWFLGGAVYTDTLSMPFPALIFYLYLRSREVRGGKKLPYYLLIGLAAGVGGLIKVTVVIMALALLIDLLLRREWRSMLALAACALGLTLALGGALNVRVYSNHLSREEAAQNNTPLLHWVMMGLKDSGYYNPEDYEFTRALPPEGRNKALLAEIVRRVETRGPLGMADLFSRKSAADFGDGTYGADDFLKIYPETDTPLHAFVLPDGAYYGLYRGAVTALHLALLGWMLAGACRFVRSGTREGRDWLPLYAAFFGLWLFLMCWETNRRYFSNFAPVMIAAAVLALSRACLPKKR